MKKGWPLLFYCFLFIGTKAQIKRTETDLRSFAGSDSTGLWLITLKPGSDYFFADNSTTQVVRQLSPHHFIVRGNPGQFLLSTIEAMVPANDNWKLSPQLLTNPPASNSSNDFYIVTDSVVLIKQMLAQDNAGTIVYENHGLLLVRSDYNHIKKIIPDKNIRFVDLANRKAKEEAAVNGFDYTLNRVNILHNLYPSDDGNAVTISVKENRPDTADIDFKNRFLLTSAAPTTLSAHATTMATIIAGGGNSFYTARGVAPGATISAASFDILLPNADSFYRNNHISVQNHSYGTGIENFYGADAAAYDASAYSNLSLLHVFSSGNSGDQTSSTGAFAGIPAFANLTGSFKMAKNIITVGSADSFAAVPLLSSKGPAYDGRIKPEIVAYGEDGSSGAAALVSGTAAVLQKIYKTQHADTLPDAALVKAILLNTAIKIDNQPVDFSSGYGNLDAHRAAQAMKTGTYVTGTIAGNQTASFPLDIPVNAKNLKVLLCWTDPPANPNAFTALVTDLDLTVMHTQSGRQWLPWVLNSFPHKDSLQLPATRKRDSLNVSEQVTIDDPPAGLYMMNVNGRNIPSGIQKFFIAYQWDTANNFRWTYPTAGDNILPGRQVLLRWNSTINSNAKLEFRYAGTNNWQLISNNAVLNQSYVKWVTPDSNAVAQLRMTINGQSLLSDSFSISSPLQTGVGFNCTDSVLIYWNKTNAGKYTVRQLGDRYMEPFASTTDTFLIIHKNVTANKWFNVTPVLAFNKTGISSNTFNYSTQGVNCYISSFTADLVNRTAALSILFGSLYQLAGISIEKTDQQGGYHVLKSFVSPFSTQYTATDSSLMQGINRYRVKIILQTGQVIYSDVQAVYALGDHRYLLYPNPVNRPQSFTILSDQLSNPLLRLFNVYGQQILEKKLLNLSEQISTAQLPKGVYLYVITGDQHQSTTGKIIVQ